MLVICIISYMLAGIINLFYGHYRDYGFNWFLRASLYFVTAIIFEVPNILCMYIIHWKTYKPVTITEVYRSGNYDNQSRAHSAANTHHISESNEQTSALSDSDATEGHY
jgi:ABC-type arginine transport system permease subunit